jgi:sulfide:quinone oxidoreductase
MNVEQMTTTGKQIVVVGGSFAGLAAAYSIRERVASEDRVTVISGSDRFTFAPSLIWAVVGTPLLHSAFFLEHALSAKGIEFIRAHVRDVNVAEHTVTFDGDEKLRFDRLVIATGGRPDAQAIPGLAGEFRAVSWIVDENSAMEARNVINELYRNPGPLVIGAAPRAGYLSALYELALTLDTALREKGIRDQVPITFVTSEPYLGHLGFGQTAARPRLERMFAERDIESRTGAEIRRARPCEVELETDERLPVHAAVLMPPFTGAVDIWKSARLTDDAGMIPVTPQYRHTIFDDIYAVGVASYFEQPVPPLEGQRAPQTGYLSVHMGKIAGQNLAASLGYGTQAQQTLPSLVDVRVIDGGNTGLLLTSRGNQSLRHTAVQLPGGSAHSIKAALERYELWRLRTGRIALP